MSANLKDLHPDALCALHKVFVQANLKPVIVQILGSAAQSAGTHECAGHYQGDDGAPHPYSVCVDFSVRQLATRLSDGAQVEMNEARIKWFLEHLAEFKIAAFHRVPAQGFTSEHIHGITTMVPMSLPVPQHQVFDFVTGRNGLKSHAKETFYQPSHDFDVSIARAFLEANPRTQYTGALQSLIGGS